MKPDEFGGTQPVLIVGNQVHILPDYCTVLDFNRDGCTVVSLRRSDDESINWADATANHGRFANVSLTDKEKPYFVQEKDANGRLLFWTHVELSAGSLWAHTTK